jgi:predicted nucleotidyltransferase
VILTGSLARGDFRQGSDIDLAADGIPPELFFQAGAGRASMTKARSRLNEELAVDDLALFPSGKSFRAAMSSSSVGLRSGFAMKRY